MRLGITLLFGEYDHVYLSKLYLQSMRFLLPIYWANYVSVVCSIYGLFSFLSSRFRRIGHGVTYRWRWIAAIGPTTQKWTWIIKQKSTSAIKRGVSKFACLVFSPQCQQCTPQWKCFQQWWVYQLDESLDSSSFCSAFGDTPGTSDQVGGKVQTMNLVKGTSPTVLISLLEILSKEDLIR